MYFVALDGYLQGTLLGYSREWVERSFEKPSCVPVYLHLNDLLTMLAETFATLKDL